MWQHTCRCSAQTTTLDQARWTAFEWEGTVSAVAETMHVRKLIHYGVQGQLLQWLRSILLDTRVSVRVNDHFSSPVALLFGVPQGSVLGPGLFLVYINHVVRHIDSWFLLFADDAKLWRMIRSFSDCKALQHDLDQLHLWSIENRMPLNIGKWHTLPI